MSRRAASGKTAPAEIEAILTDRGLTHHVWAPEPHDITDCLRAAMDAGSPTC